MRLSTAPDLMLPDDLLVLQGGSTGYKHVGIVTRVADAGRFATVEGNTNQAGSAEGDGVYAKLRDPAEEPCVFVRVS